VIHLLEYEYTYSESSSFKAPFVIAISSHMGQNVDGRAVYPILVLFELQVPTVWMKKAFEKPHPIRQGQNTGQQLFKHFPGYGHMP